jgi:hypothetical protein
MNVKTLAREAHAVESTPLDELLRQLHHRLVPLRDDDAVIARDGRPLLIVSATSLPRVAEQLGGDTFARKIVALQRPAGHVIVIVLTDTEIGCFLVRLVPLSRGGAA